MNAPCEDVGQHCDREAPLRVVVWLGSAAASAAEDLLDAAERRMSAAAPQVGISRHERGGHLEREVMHAADDLRAELLVVARDGDPDRLGPGSLAPPTRFVVDHAPCALLLVWPRPAPRRDSDAATTGPRAPASTPWAPAAARVTRHAPRGGRVLDVSLLAVRGHGCAP